MDAPLHVDVDERHTVDNQTFAQILMEIDIPRVVKQELVQKVGELDPSKRFDAHEFIAVRRK